MMTALTITWYFIAILAAYSVLGAASEMNSGFAKIKKGEIFTMECNTKDNEKDSLSLYARLPSKHLILVYDKLSENYTSHSKYKERVKISGTMHKLTMKISDMQPIDSGLYIGQYSKFNLKENAEEKEEGCSILLFVNDEESTGKGSFAMSEPLVMVFALIAGTMLIVCILVMLMLAPKVKRRCLKRANASREFNPVYEDMHRLQSINK